MKTTCMDTGGTTYETIAILTAISRVSARLARNMTLLAKQRQSSTGGKSNESECRTDDANKGKAL